jgi:hypothetical protein
LSAIGLDDEELTFNSLRLCFLGGGWLNDTYECPSLAQNAERSLKRAPANRVENDIYIRHFIFEVNFRVINHFLGAELSYKIVIIGRCSRDHGRSRPIRHLHCKACNPARTAVN